MTITDLITLAELLREEHAKKYPELEAVDFVYLPDTFPVGASAQSVPYGDLCWGRLQAREFPTIMLGTPLLTLQVFPCFKDRWEFVTDIIIHELAHIIERTRARNCTDPGGAFFMMPDPHGEDWVDVCRDMGGTAAITGNDYADFPDYQEERAA